jgi:hypothetical protein
MTEPASATFALLTGAAVATASAASTIVPGLDSNALVGAISGGALFVTSARDLPLWQRLAYLVVSAGAGYIAAPEVMRHMPIQSTGVAAFLAGALIVTLTTQLIERVKTLDLTALANLFKRGA